VHFEFKKIRGLLLQMLSTTTLEQLALGVKSGDFFLKTLNTND
jgi:hypothetical protein